MIKVGGSFGWDWLFRLFDLLHICLGYARDENDVARDLYAALVQFFTLFEAYRGRPFFATGESYAGKDFCSSTHKLVCKTFTTHTGKYVPAIAHRIHQAGDEAKAAGINLQGLAIGDGLCDPRNMGGYGPFLFQVLQANVLTICLKPFFFTQVGLIDEPQREHFNQVEKAATELIDAGQYFKAFQLWDELLNGDLTANTGSYFKNATGLNYYYNFLLDTEPADFEYYNAYLGLSETREVGFLRDLSFVFVYQTYGLFISQAIHVGNRPYNDGAAVEQHIVNDIMQSVRPWVEELLDAGYRTLIYSGQLDIIVAAPLSENFLQALQWKGKERYRAAPRTIYKVGQRGGAGDNSQELVAGYVRQVDGLLYQIIIRNAGHILPYDQPLVAHDMITRFVRGDRF